MIKPVLDKAPSYGNLIKKRPGMLLINKFMKLIPRKQIAVILHIAPVRTHRTFSIKLQVLGNKLTYIASMWSMEGQIN